MSKKPDTPTPLRDEELLNSRRQFRLALKAANVGAWEWDMASNEARWSAENYRLLGYEPGSGHANYEDWMARVHPDDREFAEREVTRAIEEKGDLDFEFRAVWPDGSLHWIRDVGRVLLDDGGEPIGMYGLQMDVTEKRALEENLRTVQRTETLGRVAAAVAHNFNNLFTVIIGYSSLLGPRIGDDATALQMIEEITLAAERAGELTRHLLAFGRRQVLQSEVLMLNDVIERLEDLIRSSLGEAINLRLDLDPNLACVRVDPSQIEQALIQLAVRVRDVMPDGGSFVLKTRNRHLTEKDVPPGSPLQPGPCVLMSIHDSSDELDSESLQHIFDPFAARKSAVAESELHLASLHGFIAQSGGWLTADSASGSGTTFTIYLPPAQVEARPSVGSLQRHTTTLENGAILFVEDDPMIRRLFATSLEAQGLRVHAAGSAEEALDLMANTEGRLDLLISDIVLPGASGIELAAEIRSMRPGTPVVLISGYGRDQVSDIGELGDRVSLLNKPFTPSDLLERVRSALTTEPPSDETD